MPSKTKFVEDLRGQSIPIPGLLSAATKEIRAVANNKRREKILESTLGALLKPTYDDLLSRKDSEGLLTVATFLSEIGSWTAHYFYAAYYQLNPNKIR